MREKHAARHREVRRSRKAEILWLLHLACIVLAYCTMALLVISILFQRESTRPLGWGALVLMFAALGFDELRYRAEDGQGDQREEE